MPPTPEPNPGWSPDTWQQVGGAHQFEYDDPQDLARVLVQLAAFPPLVTSWEIERLKKELAQAQAGERFLLQGGDCAEMLRDCTPGAITNKLKILLQMSLVLVHASKKPVIRVGRFAGQYAKPRSSPTETRVVDGQGVTLPSYFGDLVNAPEFEPQARRPDPMQMLRAYTRSALSLNFIRSLVEGGFADLHHPEYWDLSFFSHASLAPVVRDRYERMVERLGDGLRFMEALGERTIDDLTRVEFFTSHEGLNLYYEQAQTRTVPRREGWYDLTTHMPWIGDRARQPDGAHVEFFRGVRNPVGVKIGAEADPAQIARVCQRLNPGDEPGKVVLITRLGAERVRDLLPRLISRVADAAGRVLWVCDPMHANTQSTTSGIKTRSFDAILAELETTFETHAACGSHLGGVHFELTGEDVTECVGGAAGVTEADLSTRYASFCDPRLNYQQALEMAMRLGTLMGRT
ncbi:MAG: 3-deoxy-7-phosphoheptulonate synthase [Phycisphaerales bacterium]|nr:3-deoxy-7-phosphoheptulonate synthase [Phycisphaerales bacterium]